MNYLSLSRRNRHVVRGSMCVRVRVCVIEMICTKSGSLPRLLFTIVIEKKRACKIGRPFSEILPLLTLD